MRRLFAFAPLLLLAGLVVAGGVALFAKKPETHFVSADNRPAPNFELTRLGGGDPVRAADFAGRPYVINLFASWCGPCQAEHPLLLDLKRRGVPIVGVAYKDEEADAAAFIARLGDPFAAIALDPDGRFGLDVGTTGLPDTFVIDADGRILVVHRGPLTEQAVRDEILPALNGS